LRHDSIRVAARRRQWHDERMTPSPGSRGLVRERHSPAGHSPAACFPPFTCIHRLSKSRDGPSHNVNRPTCYRARRRGDPSIPKDRAVGEGLWPRVHPIHLRHRHVTSLPTGRQAILKSRWPGRESAEPTGLCRAHFPRNDRTRGHRGDHRVAAMRMGECRHSWRHGLLLPRVQSGRGPGVRKRKSRVSVVVSREPGLPTWFARPTDVPPGIEPWTYGTRLPVKRTTV